jgi:hypothetical protein
MRYTGAQINFGDLTPYLTYAFKYQIEDLHSKAKDTERRKIKMGL